MTLLSHRTLEALASSQVYQWLRNLQFQLKKDDIMCELSEAYLRYFKEKVNRQELAKALEFLLKEIKQSEQFSAAECDLLQNEIAFVWIVPEDGSFNLIATIKEHFPDYEQFVQVIHKVNNQRPQKSFALFGNILESYIMLIYENASRVRKQLHRHFPIFFPTS